MRAPRRCGRWAVASSWLPPLLVLVLQTPACVEGGKKPPPPPPPPPCTLNCGSHGSPSSQWQPCKCNCGSGWSGNTCTHETGCDGNPCHSHGSCTPLAGRHTCECSTGWEGVNCDKCKTPCRANPAGQHATSCGTKCYKETCTVKCHTGYTPTKSTTYTCGSSGMWSVSSGSPLVCKGVKCGANKIDPPVANVAKPACSQGTYNEDQPDTCTLACAEGYTSNGQGSSQYTCEATGKEATGKWKPSHGSLVCRKKRCSSPPDGKDPSHINPCEGAYQDTCDATCNHGYQAASSSNDSTYTCHDKPHSRDGQWGGGSLVCEGVPCTKTPPPCGDASPTPSHGSCLIKDCDPGKYGDKDESSSTCVSDNDEGNGKSTTAICHAGYQEKKGSINQYKCDETGHWSGGALQCEGKSCGAAPMSGKGAKWPFGLFPSCSFRFDPLPAERADSKGVLIYSEAELSGPGCTEVEHCKCTQSCSVGYSHPDGKAPSGGGIQTKTFQCVQDNGKVHLDDDQPLTCKAITCGAITNAPGYPDPSTMLSLEDKPLPLASYPPRCGSKIDAVQGTSDPAGVMRYDKDGIKNKCTATCKEGYTKSERSQQDFVCGEPDPDSGLFNGKLSCDIIECSEKELRAVVHGNLSSWAGCLQSNNNKFGKTCKVECEVGYTRSVPPTADVQPWECQAVMDDPYPNQDLKWKRNGIWRYPPATSTNPHNDGDLKCHAVQCPALKRRTMEWQSSNDPKASKATSRPRDDYKSDEQLCTYGPSNETHNPHQFLDTCTFECLAGWYPVASPGDTSKCLPATRAAGECKWWLPENAGPPLDNAYRKVTYTCSEDGKGSDNGVWCPGPHCTGQTNQSHAVMQELYCVEGLLNSTNSMLLVDKTKVATEQQVWPDQGVDVRNIESPGGPGVGDGITGHNSYGFLGYRFGRGKGPKYNFRIQTRDHHNQPRNYNNLHQIGGMHPDFIETHIKRVPWRRLRDCGQKEKPCFKDNQGQPRDRDFPYGKPVDRDLQPQTMFIGVGPGGTVPATGCMRSAGSRDCKVREYSDSEAIILSNNEALVNIKSPEDAENGEWEVTHQFSEHGVFYLEVYVCPQATAGSCKDPKHLVPGTGLIDSQGFPLHADALPESAFTVCPQGTDNTASSGAGELTNFIRGSDLRHCLAKANHFSPEGPGHVAQKCNDEKDSGVELGLNCQWRGMTWPVARPGFWISPYDPGHVVRCTALGACPGSIQYGVGTQRYLQTGEPKEESCWGKNPATDQFVYTPFFQDDSRVNMGRTLDRNPCYMVDGTDVNYITRGRSSDSRYTLVAHSMNGTKDLRCWDQVGSRCCPGARGDGCSLCCRSETNLDKEPYCTRQQWHTVELGEGGHCEECPNSEIGPFLWVLVAVFVLVLAPVVARLSELARYAGAAQGPVLSVFNFFQSGDLFQGLNLHWPKEFKYFCRKVATWFSFNISAILSELNKYLGFLVPKWMKFHIPSPECALHLTYQQKWALSMLSPFILFCALLLFLPMLDVAKKHWRKLKEATIKKCRCRERCCHCCQPKDQAPLRAQRQSHLKKVQRFVLIWLMIGYIFLAKNALEPLACSTNLDGNRYMISQSASDIQCEWCHTKEDEVQASVFPYLTYRHLATISIIAFTIYGIGTPCLFFIILYRNRKVLHTNAFNEGFGFLSTKMREEYYWWESFISVRKLLLVSFTKWSYGQELPFTLIQLFVLVLALAAQVRWNPFAHDDANIAETVTLLSIILILILGLASKFAALDVGDIPKDSNFTCAFKAVNPASSCLYGTAATFLNLSIYLLGGALLLTAVKILLTRLVGAYHSMYNRKLIEAARERAEERATAGHLVPDHILDLLAKRKQTLVESWVAIKSKDRNNYRKIMHEVFESAQRYRDNLSKEEQKAGYISAGHERYRHYKWESFFPDDMQPIMYAWALREGAPEGQREKLEWLMEQIEEMDKEQHQIWPLFRRCARSLCSYCCCCFCCCRVGTCARVRGVPRPSQSGTELLLVQPEHGTEPEPEPELMADVERENGHRSTGTELPSTWLCELEDKIVRPFEGPRRVEDLHTINNLTERQSIDEVTHSSGRLLTPPQAPESLATLDQRLSLMEEEDDTGQLFAPGWIPSWFVSCCNKIVRAAVEFRSTVYVLLFGSDNRVTATFFFFLFSCFCTMFFLVQFFADKDALQRWERESSEPGRVPEDIHCEEASSKHAWWWLMYLSLFYGSLLLLAPTLVCLISHGFCTKCARQPNDGGFGGSE